MRGLRVVIMAVLGTVFLSFPAVADQPCVTVDIGDDRAPALGCINELLLSQVDKVRPPSMPALAGMTSAAVEVGGFNLRSVRQQYGSNFGKSSVPYRPLQTYGPALRSRP